MQKKFGKNFNFSKSKIFEITWNILEDYFDYYNNYNPKTTTTICFTIGINPVSHSLQQEQT